jgi:2-isopropylmalate synthase
MQQMVRLLLRKMFNKKKQRRVYIYDSTLRDGAQTAQVDFSLQQKLNLAKKIDSLGIDFIEAGWPGANKVDSEFYENLPKLKNSKIVPFGMTRRANQKAEDDQLLGKLLAIKTEFVTIVGKAWDFHVKHALKTSLKENLQMIADSISFLKSHKREVIFDAEHFFDGYKENSKYALEVVKVALDAGARWVVLCDTNGGCLPFEVEEIVSNIVAQFGGERISIHCHDDTGNAVANSLMAVRAGASQVQGTINGLGERTGNANLVTIIAVLKLKMNIDVGVSDKSLLNLTSTSNYLYDVLNLPYDKYAPFVGKCAFAHKGGLHGSAFAKNPRSYEHVEPERVGNKSDVIISDQAGRASVLIRLNELKIPIPKDDNLIKEFVAKIKDNEAQGFSYDSCDASFALLALEQFGSIPEYYQLINYKVINEKRINAKGKMVNISDAVFKIKLAGNEEITAAEGNGPVNALYTAFKLLLSNHYPALSKIMLCDYKVRIIDSEQGTGALIRVLVEMKDSKSNYWTSIGVSTDLINASYMALSDAVRYFLYVNKTKVK